MTNVKAPKQPKRKLTPYEKMDKVNTAHMVACRKAMAKIRAESKQLPDETFLSVALEYYQEALTKYDLVHMALKRGHTLFMASNKYADA